MQDTAGTNTYIKKPTSGKNEMKENNQNRLLLVSVIAYVFASVDYKIF